LNYNKSHLNNVFNTSTSEYVKENDICKFRTNAIIFMIL
jgi:hypothetical protein